MVMAGGATVGVHVGLLAQQDFLMGCSANETIGAEAKLRGRCPDGSAVGMAVDFFLFEQQDLAGEGISAEEEGEGEGEAEDVEEEQRHRPPLRQLQGFKSCETIHEQAMRWRQFSSEG